MATIQAVQYSMNGEPLVKSRLGKSLSGLVTYPVEETEDEKTGKKVKKVIYPSGKEWYIFKLVDNNKKGGVRLSNIDDVMNPETGRVERIRLLTGVESIWVKDQKDLPKDYEKTNWVELRFFRGQKMMRIHHTNHTALEFCRLTNSNVGNPLRTKGSRHEFYEYDSVTADKELFEKEEFELNMAIEAKGASLETMKKHAAFLGIRLVNEIGEPKSPDGIRREYVMYAKRNPEYFQKTMNTQQIEINWLVRRAISESLIDTGREAGRIYWAKGGELICACPVGSDHIAYLTDLALTNTDEGKRFKELLKQVAT